MKEKLNVVFNPEFEKFSKPFQMEYLTKKLNRPIRVCGMVKNEGEPGGGPFWVKDDKGNISLQIVESAQIDKIESLRTKLKSYEDNFLEGVDGSKISKYNLNTAPF